MPQLTLLCQRVAVLVPLLCVCVHCQWTTVNIYAATNATDTTASTTTEKTTTTITTTTTTTAPITTTIKPTTVTAIAAQNITTVVASETATSTTSNVCLPCAIVIPIVAVVIIVAVIIIVVRRRRCQKQKAPGPIPRPDSMDPFSTEQHSSSTAHLEQHAETINGGTVSAVRPAISNGNTHQLQNTSAPHVAVPVPTGELTADDELYLNSDQINNNQLPVVRTDSLQSMMPPVGQPQPIAYRDPLAPDTGPRLGEPPKPSCGPVKPHDYVNVQSGTKPQQSQQDVGEDQTEYMNCNELENADPRYVNLGPILEHMKASRNETANQAEV